MNRRVWIASCLVSLGTASLIAGLANLATDVTQVDHDYGYGFVALSALALIVGIVVFSASPSPPTPGSRGVVFQGNVASYDQKGGQTAGIIANIGPQPRTIKGKNIRAVVIRLSRFAGTEVQIASLLADNEGASFAFEIRALVEEAGWSPKGAGISATLLGFGMRGIVIRSRSEDLPPALRELAGCLAEFGYDVELTAGSDVATGNEVLILGNPA